MFKKCSILSTVSQEAANTILGHQTRWNKIYFNSTAAGGKYVTINGFFKPVYSADCTVSMHILSVMLWAFLDKDAHP